ncbi:MAG: adenylate/guanylate cyclase domain-containing protein [Bacteroidia bacterium]
MKIKFFFLFAMLSRCTGITQLYAQPAIILTDSASLISIGKLVDVFEDKSAMLDLQKILQPEYQSQFKRSQFDVPNLGTTHSVLWCRFALQNNSGREWFLRIDNPYLDTIQLFIQHGKSFQEHESGRNFSFNDREIKTTNFIFPLNLQKDSVQLVYLRIKHHVLYLPLDIGQLGPLLEKESKYNYYFGIYFGIVVAILLINFMMFFSIRDKSLLYYIGYVTCFGLYASIQKGYFIQWIPDALLWISPHSAVILYPSMILIPLFSISFLKAKELSPLFYKLNIALIIYGIVDTAIYLSGNRVLASTLLQMFSIIATVIVIIFSSIIYKKGYNPARFYLVAFSGSMAGYCVFAMQTKALIPTSFLSQNSLVFGTLWEMIFLSLAVGDKIINIRKEMNLAQQEALAASKENENLVLNQNIILEQKVEERTHELEAAKKQADELLLKSDELLLNILPYEIANELKSQGHSQAKTYSMVTVMFTDFKDFSEISEKVSGELLVAEIDHCFSAFDNIIHKYVVEKIKTVGDAYICVGGLPVLNFTHAADTINAAIEIRNFMIARKNEKEARGEIPFEIRIGIHTGPVVAGIVGIRKFAYDIWGDTVNVASRLEASGEPGKINISETTYDLVKNKFSCIHRGKIEAKNKGLIDMYFVEKIS